MDECPVYMMVLSRSNSSMIAFLMIDKITSPKEFQVHNHQIFYTQIFSYYGMFEISFPSPALHTTLELIINPESWGLILCTSHVIAHCCFVLYKSLCNHHVSNHGSSAARDVTPNKINFAKKSRSTLARIHIAPIRQD